MRVLILKLAGLVLWGMFLFAPFVARADGGFALDAERAAAAAAAKGAILAVGVVDIGVGGRDPFRIPLEDKWSVKFNAGREAALRGGFQAHDDAARYIRPLDGDPEQRGLRVGIGLNYVW